MSILAEGVVGNEELIVSTIVSYLSPHEVRKARLVSKLWCKIATATGVRYFSCP